MKIVKRGWHSSNSNLILPLNNFKKILAVTGTNGFRNYCNYWTHFQWKLQFDAIVLQFLLVINSVEIISTKLH